MSERPTSTTQSLEMLFGTAPSTAWSTTYWGWWPVGPLSATSGTCQRCTRRCVVTKSSCGYNMWAPVNPERRLILPDFPVKLAGWWRRSAVCQQGEVSHRPPGGAGRSPVVKKNNQPINLLRPVFVKIFFCHHSVLVCVCRDGGLKRAKVKESFKEEQQKQYSNMVVGDDSSGHSDWATARKLRQPPGSASLLFFVVCFLGNMHISVLQCALASWTSVFQVDPNFFFFFFVCSVKCDGVPVTHRSHDDCCWTHGAAELSVFFNCCWRY